MCHQTVSLVARHLEDGGIPTVIAGSARDIVEESGVPRFVFTDFPLGNPTGKPYDVEMQQAIVSTCLETLERAWEPRTTIQTPFVWDDDNDDSWRAQFMLVDESNRETLAQAGDDRRNAQKAAKIQGKGRE